MAELSQTQQNTNFVFYSVEICQNQIFSFKLYSSSKGMANVSRTIIMNLAYFAFRLINVTSGGKMT